jgi:hypothetical protein
MDQKTFWILLSISGIILIVSFFYGGYLAGGGSYGGSYGGYYA